MNVQLLYAGFSWSSTMQLLTCCSFLRLKFKKNVCVNMLVWDTNWHYLCFINWLKQKILSRIYYETRNGEIDAIS